MKQIGSNVQEDSIEVEEIVVSSNDEARDDRPIELRKPTRNTGRLTNFNDIVAYALPVVSEDIPLSYLEARNSSEVTQ